mgnify:CR=1 FL=1
MRHHNVPYIKDLPNSHMETAGPMYRVYRNESPAKSEYVDLSRRVSYSLLLAAVIAIIIIIIIIIISVPTLRTRQKQKFKEV